MRHLLCFEKNELAVECKNKQIKLVVGLEEVGTMHMDHRNAITTLFGSDPLLIQTADFGWVQRARLYWTYGVKVDERISTDTYELMPKGTALMSAAMLIYTGAIQPQHWLSYPC